MSLKTLKKRIRAGEKIFGQFMLFDFWPGYLEMYKSLGYDFVIVDAEHGSVGLSKLEELCRTARLLDFPLIIRPVVCSFALIKKYLDMGSAGVMVPWLESGEQMETLHDATFLPPTGRRGPGGPCICGMKNLKRADWDEYEEKLIRIVQIESRHGVSSVDTIAGFDWLDAVILGPYDLSLDLDCVDDPASSRQYLDAIDKIHAACGKKGKCCGMVAGTPEDAVVWIKRGFNLIICSILYRMAIDGAKRFIEEIKDRM